MLKEFQEFINKGNVMDLAVGVIIGAAFKAIIDSLVADILMPLIGIIMGGHDLTTWSITVGGAVLKYGNFIQAILNFLLIAFVLFLFVKWSNGMRAKTESLRKK
ncbi:MAG TPA: large conductance mechanosensitive channel protein MscL [Anaerolineales bacterium]|nr:large conductance mechanosensitive channel protein MscL [Anaerolineales bacterium]